MTGFDGQLESIDCRIRDGFTRVFRNSAGPMDYVRRHANGQSISSAVAKSTVNQVINTRMCKRLANGIDFA